MLRNSSRHPSISIAVSPSSDSTSHQHACITMNRTDRLRLIRFPPTVIETVRQAILASWQRGLQKERMFISAYEFKLVGNPWRGQRDEAVEARIMMMAILTALYRQGWYLLTSTDISKKKVDKDTLIFQLGVPPPATSFFVVSFNEGDKLRLIGAPSELKHAVQQTLGKNQIQNEKWISSQKAYQFKLRGNPWYGGGNEAVTSRVKALALLDCFATFDWYLHASIDMSLRHRGSGADTWFLRRIHE